MSLGGGGFFFREGIGLIYTPRIPVTVRLGAISRELDAVKSSRFQVPGSGSDDL